MINKISCRLWDIDKYIDFLKSKYSAIKEIKYLPMYEKWYNDYILLSYDRHSRLIMRGHEIKDTNKGLTKSEQKHFNFLGKHIERLKQSVNDVVFLDWFNKQGFAKVDFQKKYFVFDKQDLENFDIDIVLINYWLTDFVCNSFDDYVLSVDEQFLNSPLPLIDFYKSKIVEINDMVEFQFLDFIFSARLIDGLDDSSRCMAVALELIYIKQIKYLETRIYDLENTPTEQNNSSDFLEMETIEEDNLSQKQIALLFQSLLEIGVFSKEFNSLDNTRQAKIIAGMAGIKITNVPSDWNFYKYWTSIRGIDKQKVLTQSNIKKLLTYVTSMGDDSLITNVKEKLSKIK